MVKVRVPATSANLGVGYDCLGLALDDFATVTFEVIAEGLEIAGCEEAYCNEENLFYQAFVKGLQYMGEKRFGNPHHRGYRYSLCQRTWQQRNLYRRRTCWSECPVS